MNKIVIIGCYFGRLRNDYKTWLKTCSYNPSIDWLIFSDCKWEDLPNNVKVVNLKFPELVKHIRKCFDFDICLNTAYKLCDYKVAYGYIFSDYIKEYDFWGYCDFDMMFGDIRKFVDDKVLKNHHKVYHLGHLSLYKNENKINKMFMSKKGDMYYKDVFKTSIIKVFDEESGILPIFERENLKVFKKLDFVDISKYTKKMLHSNLEKYFDFKKPKNYHYQTFMFDNGKLFKVYKKFFSKKINYEEIVYLHYSGKNYPLINSDKFLITSKGLKEVSDNLFKYDVTYCLTLEKLCMLFREFKFRFFRKINKIKQQKKEIKYE